MNDKYLDECIKSNLKEMIESDIPIDIEKSWEDFQRRIIMEPKPKRKVNKKHLIALIAVITLAIIITPMMAPNEVTAFKSKVFEWLNVTDDEIIISRKTNPKIKEGHYKDLNLEEAKSMVIYHLSYPRYIPSGIEANPKIDIRTVTYPYSITTMHFSGENKIMIFSQRNTVGEGNANIHLPKDTKVNKILIDDVEYTVINRNQHFYNVIWHNNSMSYDLLTNNISYEEILKILGSIE